MGISYPSNTEGKDALFQLLQRTCVKCNPNAPIYALPEDLEEFEKRQHLQILRKGREVASGVAKNRIAATMQWLKSKLSALVVQARRRAYFEEAK